MHIGANHCRLRRNGWEKCGHGLTSRPRESASEGFLNELLLLFGTLLGPLLLCWRELCLFGMVLVGSLVGSPLGAFLLMVPLRLWLLKAVRMLVFCGWSRVLPLLCLVLKVVGDGGDWISGPGGGVKRVRLNRKTPAHLVRHGILGIQSRPRVWKRLRVQDHSGQYHADAKARRGTGVIADSAGRFCCSSCGSQLVPASSGYVWISRELHAAHRVLRRGWIFWEPRRPTVVCSSCRSRQLEVPQIRSSPRCSRSEVVLCCRNAAFFGLRPSGR